MNELLKKKRLEAGMSALRLAQLSDSQEMRIYNFERGRFLPRPDEALRISGVLGADPRKLFPGLVERLNEMEGGKNDKR